MWKHQVFEAFIEFSKFGSQLEKYVSAIMYNITRLPARSIKCGDSVTDPTVFKDRFSKIPKFPRNEHRGTRQRVRIFSRSSSLVASSGSYRLITSAVVCMNCCFHSTVAACTSSSSFWYRRPYTACEGPKRRCLTMGRSPRDDSCDNPAASHPRGQVPSRALT